MNASGQYLSVTRLNSANFPNEQWTKILFMYFYITCGNLFRGKSSALSLASAGLSEYFQLLQSVGQKKKSCFLFPPISVKVLNCSYIKLKS